MPTEKQKEVQKAKRESKRPKSAEEELKPPNLIDSLEMEEPSRLPKKEESIKGKKNLEISENCREMVETIKSFDDFFNEQIKIQKEQVCKEMVKNPRNREIMFTFFWVSIVIFEVFQLFYFCFEVIEANRLSEKLFSLTESKTSMGFLSFSILLQKTSSFLIVWLIEKDVIIGELL